MTPEQFHAARQYATTPSGKIAYVERGEGPAALFIHGIPLNGYHWRHVMTDLGDMRRCIAPDLMGLGYSEVAATQDLSFEAQARMLSEFLDALGIGSVDLVGNDSGGAIAQILAVETPERVRSLTLTNCDVHDNWPPEAFKGTFDMASAGQLGDALALALSQPELARSPAALGAAFQFPERLTDEALRVYLEPVTETPERKAQLDRYVASMDCAQTLRIHHRLKQLAAPALIVWGDSDVFFPVKWAHWLSETLPGTRKLVELKGARLFFPEERADELCPLIRAHWQEAV